jgi:outer membrane protein OmpA-like peptidoglycan-associated protein
MCKGKLLILSFLLTGFSLIATGQVNDNHAVAAKVLLIDPGLAQDDGSLDQTFGLEIAYQRHLGNYFGLAVPIKIGVVDVANDTRNRNITSVDGLLHVFPFTSQKTLSPYLLGGIGYVLEDLESSNVQMPLGLGLNWKVGQTSYVTLQGEYRMSNQELRDNVQVGLGYIYRFGASDRDGDGLNDGVDACPDIYGLPELGGCPDQDNDGIADQDDACPARPGPAATNGCPDTDGDGFLDPEDDCPETPGKVQGCPDTDGDGLLDKDDACPTLAGPAGQNGCPDTDGDGLNDLDDDCPDQAGTRANGGCPLSDRDGDGVPDADDRCPDKAGPYTGCPDTDGDGLMDADDRCPEEAGLLTNKGCPEIEEEDQDVLELAMRAVQFELGSADLKSESYAILDQIAGIMDRYPAYRLLIAGHTDSIGDADDNLKLSENRAKACYLYLVEKGIDPVRMSHAGYGEMSPVADNDRSAGRRLNRRVEFSLVIE